MKLSQVAAKQLLGEGATKKSGFALVFYRNEGGVTWVQAVDPDELSRANVERYRGRPSFEALLHDIDTTFFKHYLVAGETVVKYGGDEAPTRQGLSRGAVTGVLKAVATALSLPLTTLEKVSAAPTAEEVINRLVDLQRAEERTEDPLYEFTKGSDGIKRQMMKTAGGALTSKQVAGVLGMSEVGVRKRVNAGTLLALELGKRGLRYPRAQFTRDGVVEGLPEVLRELRQNDVDEWMALRFLVYPNARLDNRTAVQVLTEDTAPFAERKAQVLEAARAFGTHGAD